MKLVIIINCEDELLEDKDIHYAGKQVEDVAVQLYCHGAKLFNTEAVSLLGCDGKSFATVQFVPEAREESKEAVKANLAVINHMLLSLEVTMNPNLGTEEKNVALRSARTKLDIFVKQLNSQ